jgi:hypothetical protein
MAANAACDATVNLPANSRIRKLAIELRTALDQTSRKAWHSSKSTINGEPSAYDSRLPNVYTLLRRMAQHAARHIYNLDE